jgi:DNA helicase-2/ATP-dependent DNA helicase PcrA
MNRIINAEKRGIMQLDSSQQRAVDYFKGQVMVIAGAGSGKTRVLTERIGKLIQRGVKPESILAFTFTNAAADEMKNRLIKSIGPVNVELLNIGTMHSQLNRILRKNMMIWKPDMHAYTVMNDYDQRILVKDSLDACSMELNNKTNIANGRIAIAYVKNMAYSLKDVQDGRIDDFLIKLGIKWFPDFFETYEQIRRQKKFVGFDDMLWETYFLLREQFNVLNTYAELFNYMLVDEFQDTNPVQFEVVKMLQSKHKNLFVVGDPRQSVFGFRQADVSLSLDFKKHFPAGDIIELEHNYRCANNIVEMSNDLISHAEYPFARTKPVKNAGIITFGGCFEDDGGEAISIAEEIKTLVATEGVKYGDIVVLNRTNAQSRPFEEKFVKSRIPYISVEGSFYESANVKDMLCYLELIVGDSLEAFKRVYNRPNRFLGKVFFEQFEQKFRKRPFVTDCLREAYSKSNMMKAASGFGMELMILRRNAKEMNPGKAIALVRKSVNYDDWVRQNEMDYAERLEILNELQSSAESFGTIAEYTEFIRGIVEAQKKDGEMDAVRIMTIHRSKGLEFPVVFVAGVSEGVLPHTRAEDKDEERRLCYVALTRAINRVYVSYYLKRFNKQLSPSPYLEEMLLEQYSGQSVIPVEDMALAI